MSCSNIQPTQPSNGGFILLLGVDDSLFKACFGEDNFWKPFQIIILPEDCSPSELNRMLQKQGLQSLVIQEFEDFPHWDVVKQYYNTGGFVAFFGIFGEFSVPRSLSNELGFRESWDFSAYTSYRYVLTDVAKDMLGEAIADQQY